MELIDAPGVVVATLAIGLRMNLRFTFKCTQEQMRIIWNEMALFNRLGELDTRIGKKNFNSRKGKTELNEINTRMKFF